MEMLSTKICIRKLTAVVVITVITKLMTIMMKVGDYCRQSR